MITPYSTHRCSLDPCAALRRSLLETLAKMAFLFCLFIGLAGAASAATQTWSATGDGGSGTWDTTSSNWLSSSGVTWVNGNDAIFSATNAGTVTLGEAISAGIITFNKPTGSGSYILAGSEANQLTLTTGLTVNSGALVSVTAPITLGATNQNWSVTGSLAANAAISGSVGLIKTGGGTLTLAGINPYSGITRISAGTLNVTGSLGIGNLEFAGGVTNFSGSTGTNTAHGGFKVGMVADTPAVLNILPGADLTRRFNLFIGDAGAGTGGGAVYQSGGTVSTTQGTSADNLRIGSNTGGYGYYRISGGSLNTNEFGVGAGVSSVGILELTGGTVTANTWLNVGRNNGSSGLVNVVGGTLNAARIDLAWSGTNTPVAGVFNVGNANVNLTGANLGLNLSVSGTSGPLGVANLLTGGTLTTTLVRAATANPTAHFNFNGGTLKAGATNSGATFFSATNIDAVNVLSNGGTIDNNGTAITIAAPLQAPTGMGVSSGSISVPSGGAGYIGAPLVQFVGGSGTGATGYAVMNNGSVSQIVVASPGIGYQAGETLTAQFSGGGYTSGSSAASVTGISVGSLASGGMNFSGAGTATLSAANTYTGNTRVLSGTLALSSTLALQSSTLDLNGSDAGVVTFPTNAIYTLGGLTGSRNQDLGTRKVQIGNNNSSTTFAGSLSNGSLTKIGTGTLTLSGSNAYAGTTVVNNGVLNIDSGGSIAAGNTLTVADGPNNAFLSLNGGSITRTSAYIGGTGTNSTGVGAVVLNGGVFTSTGEIWLGSTGTAQGYGAMTLNSGTVNSASWFALGRGNTPGTFSTRGLLTVNGGVLNINSNNLSIGAFQLDRKATSVAAITGGAINVANDIYVGENLSGILDISGGSVTTGPTARVGFVASNSNTTGVGILNLRGGTLTTGFINAANVTGTSIFNFNGGTLRASQNTAAFMGGLTGAYLHAGGGTIDTNGKTITISQVLQSATGTGVSTIGVSGGSGYVAAPIVDISGGGGTGATALAFIDANGNLTGITVTNPGVGYTSDPTVTLVGGGGSGASIGSITTAANSTGALIKTGSGTLTLAGANNFTGDITVSSGTLIGANSGNDTGAIGGLGNVTVARTITVNDGATLGFTAGNVTGNADAAMATNIVVNSGGTLTSASAYNSLGPVTLNGGTINTLGGHDQFFGGFGLKSTITVNANANTATLASPSGTNSYYTLLQSGGNIFDVADGAAAVDLAITGSMRGGDGLIKNGAGLMAITTNITHGGPTTVNAGKLIVSGSLTGNTSVSVASGAELIVNGFINTGATATINGALKGSGALGPVIVNNGGTVAPGNGVGVLNIASLSGTNGATLALELGKTTTGIGPVGGSDYDQITASSVSLNNITLSLSATGANSVEEGDLFFLIINNGVGSVAGTFNGYAQDSLVDLNGMKFRVSYTAKWTGDYDTSDITGGRDVALQAIPEPSSWVMLFGGFGMLLSIQRLRTTRVGTR